MPAPRINMRKLKDALRLKLEGGQSHQQIADSLAISKGVVTKYVGLALAAGLDWPAVQAMDEAALERRLLSTAQQAPTLHDIDDLVAPEIKPLFGNLVVFKRAENSFHGHLPYEGERHVIQVAWLTSLEEKMRKTQRGKLSRLFKKLFGGIDRRLGAGRDKNAAHKD